MSHETRIGIPGTVMSSLLLLCSGCAVDVTCDEPEAYQAAVEVARVEPPEGLDGLTTAKEMEIPRASPQDPRPAGSPCLDIPPTIQAVGAENIE